MSAIRPLCLALLCACATPFAVQAQTVKAGAGAYPLAPKAADRAVPPPRPHGNGLTGGTERLWAAWRVRRRAVAARGPGDRGRP
jgi:hypothetical protein